MHCSRQMMLITEFVNPKLADDLRKHQIAFLDLAGNAYIQAKGLYIDVQGQKPKATMKGKGLFFPAALKLIYTLLTKPQNVNAPYRDLATDAGVAIGTITRVFAALRDQGYLMGQERKRKPINLKQLLDRWLRAYAENLRPKLMLGKYEREDHKRMRPSGPNLRRPDCDR